MPLILEITMIIDAKKLIKNKTKVYSIKDGEGTVTGIFEIYDGIEDYIEITFHDNKTVKYYPSSDTGEIRIISDALSLNYSLRDLSSKINKINFKAKYLFNQRIGVDLDLDFVINAIASLSNRAMLTLCDRTTLAQCLKSLTLEVAHVYQVNEKQAEGIVGDYMRYA
jgi:hypothetical protein